MMPRAIRACAGLALAVLIVTCTDRDLTGPRFKGVMALDLRSFRSGSVPGLPPVPIDTIQVKLIPIPADPTGEVDFDVSVNGDTLGDPLVLKLNVPLTKSPETFGVFITARGRGTIWYTATDTLNISTGSQAGPTLTARYTGVGANVAFINVGPFDTTVVSGLPVHLYVFASDSFEGTVDSVPVGYRLHDPTMGTITYPTYLNAILVPINKGTTKDSTWLIGETPTHVKDSTRIYITPSSGGGAPAQVFAISGSAQVDTPLATLPAPFVALVTDTAGIPVLNAKIAWKVTVGSGTFVGSDTTASDSFGFVRISYKLPAAIESDTIVASLVGIFAGPPPSATFTARSDTGLALSFDTTTYFVGKSQEAYSGYVRTRLPVPATMAVVLTRSDSMSPAASQIFGLLSDTVYIVQGDTLGCCVNVTGNALGSAQIIGRAAGYQPASATVIVTTPRLMVDSFLTTYTGTVSEPVVLYTADSLGNLHISTNDVVVRDSSSDSTIAQGDSATFTIPKGTFLTLVYIGGYKTGTVPITFTAPGYPPAVTQVSVDTAFLYVYAGYGYGAGLGQTTTDNFVDMPGPVRSPIVVTLTSSDPAVFTVPATVTIGKDSQFAYFPITGTGLGQATLTASAPGVVFSDSVQPVGINTPALEAVVTSTVTHGVKTELTVYAVDTLGFRSGIVTAPVTVHLSSSDSTGTVFDSVNITIPAGQASDSTGVVFNGIGTITVTATAPGYTLSTTQTTSSTAPVGVRATRAAVRPVMVQPVYPDSLRKKALRKGRTRP